MSSTRIAHTTAVVVLAAAVLSACGGTSHPALPSSAQEAAQAVIDASGVSGLSYDDNARGDAWAFFNPAPPVQVSDQTESSAQFWSADNSQHLEGAHFSSADQAAAFAQWVNDSRPDATLHFAANCGPYTVAGTIGNEDDLRTWMHQAFPGCPDPHAPAPAATPSSAPSDTATPTDTASTASSTPPASSASSSSTPAPSTTPTATAAPALTANADGSDGPATFTLTKFEVTPADSGPSLKVRVHNNAHHSAVISPKIFLNTADGQNLTFDGTSQCWTFAPGETDTLTISGFGMAEPTSNWASADVGNQSVDC